MFHPLTLALMQVDDASQGNPELYTVALILFIIFLAAGIWYFYTRSR
jgi:Mg2+ and Co2+ transporter CorA